MKKRKVKITNTGYLPDSPDRHNPMNIIPSNQITMNKVPFPIMGIDNLGNSQMMLPGVDYTFPGQYVTEIPLGKYQKGKQLITCPEGYVANENGKCVLKYPYVTIQQFGPDFDLSKASDAEKDIYNRYIAAEKYWLDKGYIPFEKKNLRGYLGDYDAFAPNPEDPDPLFNSENVSINPDSPNSLLAPSFGGIHYFGDYPDESIPRLRLDKNIPLQRQTMYVHPDTIDPKTGVIRGSYDPGDIIGKDKPSYCPGCIREANETDPKEGYYITNDENSTDLGVGYLHHWYTDPSGKHVTEKKGSVLHRDYMSPDEFTNWRSNPSNDRYDVLFDPSKTIYKNPGDAYRVLQTERTNKYQSQAEARRKADYEKIQSLKKKKEGGIYLGNYEFKNGGLVKYQDKGQVQSNIAGTNEMWVPSDAMSPEEAKQWGSLRGDALPITGAYASNKAIYKAYDYAKSKGMDYNQYLNWLQGNTKEVRAKQDEVTKNKFTDIPASKDRDLNTGELIYDRKLSLSPELVNYYASLPNSPFIRDEKTGEIIYAGPHAKNSADYPDLSLHSDYYTYAFPNYASNIEELYEDVKHGQDYVLHNNSDEEILKHYLGNNSQFKLEDVSKMRDKLSKMSSDDMLQYLFDSSDKKGDDIITKGVKTILSDAIFSRGYNDEKKWQSGIVYDIPGEVVIGNTPEEVQAQKFADEYAYESMNTPLARFLGAQPGKVNPNVAKRAKLYGYDKVAEQALKDITSTLGLLSTDSEAVRHILQNPESYKNQLLNIVNNPFNVGALSLDKTGSNKLSNINLTKEEAQKLIDKIDIIGKSPKFNYMSQATPQDKFIQGSGLGWFLPTSEAAKDANLLDAVFSPFELAGNVAGNYIDSWTQDDFRNEYPTAKNKPLAYSLTDPMGAEFLNTVYQSGLESLGTAAASRLLKGVNSTGRYLSNLHKQAFSPVRGEGTFNLSTPGLYDDVPQSLKDLQTLKYNSVEEGRGLDFGFSESPSSNMAFNRLYGTIDELAANPLNKKGKKLVKSSLSGNALEVADKKGLQDLIRHKNSGLSEEEISKFDNIVGDEMLDLDQTAIYYKAKLNQYGANKVNPKNLTWQQRLMNQVPFAKKTQTFYPESKVKFAKSDKQRELYDLFSQNNLNRPFTQEEFNIQKQLFDTPTQWGNPLEGVRFNRSLGYDVRRMLLDERSKSLSGLANSDSAKNLYRAGVLGMDLALGLAGSLAGKSNKVGPNYIDPYLNPILNKLGINTNDNRAVGNAVIPLNEPGSEMRGVRVNESDLPEDFNVIIGGEFIYENPNSVQTAEFYDRNPQFQVGDNAFRASESKAFYGVEDGKLKVGNPNEFKPETPIVPMIPANENDYQPIKEAGIGINGVSLIDKNNQLIYQTAGKGGKLLLYSPKTQNAYFIYNDGDDLQNVVDQINGLIAKDPDLRSVTLDNGRYSYFIQNEKGLRPADYEDYYEADLSREGNPGFNLVYKRPKKERYGGLVKAQKGLATASDSLDVLNSSLAAEQFYKSRGYSRDLFGPSKLNSAADFRNELERGKTNYNNAISGSGITDYSKSNQNSFNFDLRNYPNFAYSKPGKNPKHQVYQREQASAVINPQAPMVLYDDRILPQNFAGYVGPDLNPSNQLVVDSAGIYTYDKLATTPWSKLTTKQKKQRLQKFGTSGTPYKSVKEGLKTLEDVSSKPKEQELERIESKPITRLPITEPKLQPVVYPTLSNNQTNFSKVRPVYRMNYGQHKGQVEVGQDVYNNETKKWQRRMYEPEEIEYNINAGKIKQDGGPIYLGQYEFKDGGLVKIQGGGSPNQFSPKDKGWREYKTPTGQSLYLDPRFNNQRYYVDEKGNAVTPDQNMSLFDVQDNIWESGTSMAPLEVSPRYTYKKVPGALGAMETIRYDLDNGTNQITTPDVMATNREMQSFVNSFNPAGLLTEGVGNIAQGNIGEGLIQTGLSIPIVGQTIGKAVIAPLKFVGREVASTYGPALSEIGNQLGISAPLKNVYSKLNTWTFKPKEEMMPTEIGSSTVEKPVLDAYSRSLRSMEPDKAIGKLVDKSGNISINNIQAQLSTNNLSNIEKEILSDVLSKHFVDKKTIPFSDLQQAVHESVVPLNTGVGNSMYDNMGLGSLGYVSPKKTSIQKAIDNGRKELEALYAKGEAHVNKPEVQELIKDIEKTIVENENMLANAPESGTILFSNAEGFGPGSNAHFDDTTLGHTRYFVDPEEKDVFHILESQSDYAQGNHELGRALKKIKSLEKAIQKQREAVATNEELVQANPTMSDPNDPWHEFYKETVVRDKKLLEELEDDLARRTSNFGDIERNFKNVPNFSQKEVFRVKNQDRLFQENLKQAHERGFKKMRYPTAETAAKIQGYTPKVKVNRLNADIENLKFLERDSDFAKINDNDILPINEYGYKSLSETPLTKKEYLNKLKQRISEYQSIPESDLYKKIYEPEHMTILKKYEDAPKMIKKLTGQEVKTVTDGKGNTWYEIAVPEKVGINIHRKGGIVKMQDGGVYTGTFEFKDGGLVKAQKGLNKRMVRQYPGMKSVYGDRGENLNVIKDKNFIPSEYGYGDIEFIYPGSGLVTYNDEYAYQSPTPDKYTAVYNPKGANKHDVFLDMLHGMRRDPDYMELLNEFSQATRNARGADMDYFFDQDAQQDPNFVIDGREQWDNNYIDGMVRAHMYKKASQQKHLPFVNPFGSKPHGTEDYEMELEPNSPEMYQAADQIYNYIKGDKNRSLKKVKIKSLPRNTQ